MKNALAVYSSKPALKGKKLIEIGEVDRLQSHHGPTAATRVMV